MPLVECWPGDIASWTWSNSASNGPLTATLVESAAPSSRVHPVLIHLATALRYVVPMPRFHSWSLATATLALTLLSANGATALDLPAMIEAAAAQDLDMRQLQLALANAEIDDRLLTLSDGFALILGGASGSTLSSTFDLADAGSATLTGGLGLSATLPAPFDTAVSLSVPLTYIPGDDESFDVDVSLSLTQPLKPLLSRAIVGSTSSANVVTALSLLRARAAIERQRLAIHRNLVADLETMVAQRRAGAAARQRAAGVERDIEIKRLLRQHEPGSFAEARLLADLAAEQRSINEASIVQADTVAALLKRTAGAEQVSAEQLNGLAASDLADWPSVSPSRSLPAPAASLNQPVLEAAMELRRARLAVAEERVDTMPDVSIRASYAITDESLTASADLSLPLLREPIRLAAMQLANDVESAQLALTAALQDYSTARRELADRVHAQLTDMAVTANEMVILSLQLNETLAAVDAGVSDNAAADQARWQLEDASEALLLSSLRAEALAADIVELHLLERINTGDLARTTLEKLSRATE